MNNDSFLPTDYEIPKSGSGNYYKLEDGANEFIIVSKPIIGWLDWQNNKPHRFKYDNKPDAPLDPSRSIKHFWAFGIFDPSDLSVKVLEITQATIQNGLDTLFNHEKWGNPILGYTVSITKTGKDMETKYSVMAVPVSKDEIDAAYGASEATGLNLDALFVGGDPMAATQTV